MSKSFFSISNREATFKESQRENFDIIIIGGGITGAGIALEAAQNNLRVLLLEKNDYASGTSGKSTKLIHGGLRYLKQFEFKMVRDVGRERRVVYENAKHIVRPEKMLLPIYKNGSLGFFSSSVALWVYDLLGGVHKQERKKMLDKEEVKIAEPLLKNKNLKAGGVYYEYRTDDARLTIEVIKTAVSLGAICLSYTEVKEYVYDKNESIIGVKAKDCVTQKEVCFNAKIIVNAAGPWVDALRNIDKEQDGKRLMLTKGVHLVFPFHNLPISQSIYFDTSDGRMMFAIPRQNTTYIGTTDTKFVDAIDDLKVTKKDVDYLLENLCNTINVTLTSKDIVSSWAGLRPLIYEEGKSPSDVSRKDEIFVSKSGLVSIAGGKLTGYRTMAEQVLRIIYKKLSKKHVKSSKQKKLIGGAFNDEGSIENYITKKAEEAKTIGISAEQINNWVCRYGTETDQILKQVKTFEEKEQKDPDVGLLAELHFGVENESIFTLSDFLVRRTGILYFESETITNNLCQKLNNKLGNMLNKTNEQNERSIEEFKKIWAASTTFE